MLFSLSLGLDHQQLLLDELVKEQLVEEYLVNDLLEHQQRKVLVEDEREDQRLVRGVRFPRPLPPRGHILSQDVCSATEGKPGEYELES